MRDLNILLGLETYADMTDEEINVVMEYKTSIAVRDAVYQSEMDLKASEHAEVCKHQREIADNLQASFNSLVADILGSYHVGGDDIGKK